MMMMMLTLVLLLVLLVLVLLLVWLQQQALRCCVPLLLVRVRLCFGGTLRLRWAPLVMQLCWHAPRSQLCWEGAGGASNWVWLQVHV